MKNLFCRVHLWLAIPFGLIISATCFSGAILVFEAEITELCNRSLYRVANTGDEHMPMENLIEIAEQAIPEGAAITSVNIFSNPNKAYQISVSEPRGTTLFIDQYTGEVKGSAQRAEFFATTLRLHRWLLDSMKPGSKSLGKTIVGISTLLFVIILITGIIVWIPRSRKALKTRLSISVGKGRRRFWHSLHTAGGIYAIVILLVLALTGLTWSFPWYKAGFYKTFGVDTQQQAPRTTVQSVPISNANIQTVDMARNDRTKPTQAAQSGHDCANWEYVYEQLRTQNPDYKRISLSNGTATLSFNGWGNQRAVDRYSFDQETGNITDRDLYKDQGRSGKLGGWIYSLHVGNWGGLFSKTITFLAALLGGILALSGYYLWLRKSAAKRKGKKKLLLLAGRNNKT